ncbi:DUF4132 domain-containing protein [Spirillospora sp. NPDC052242]
MVEALPLPTDEDALIIPAEWLPHVRPRRGGVPGPAVDLEGPAGALRLLEGAAERVRELRGGKAGPGLAEAARRHLDGEPDPAGAAAVAVVVARDDDREGADRSHVARHRVDLDQMRAYRSFVDHWIAEHGLVFAALALLELCRTVDHDGFGRPGPGHPAYDHVIWGQTGPGMAHLLRRVRTLLAAAGDDVYAEADRRLPAVRWTSGTQWYLDWLVVYLLPTRQDDVDRCLAQGRHPGLDELVYCSLGRAGQAAAAPAAYAAFHEGTLATLFDGLGADALRPLARRLNDRPYHEERDLLLAAISLVPTDDALRILLDRRARPEAKGPLAAAMARFPVRAARLLAGPYADAAALLLREHARSHRDAITAALPGLPEAVRGTLAAVLDPAPPLPDAAPGEVPRFLADAPWERPSRPVRTGLEAPPPRVVWRDGERAEWLAEQPKVLRPDQPDWEELTAHRNGMRYPMGLGQVAVYGPEDVVRSRIADWDAPAARRQLPVRFLLARFGADALPPVLALAKDRPDDYGDALLPVLDERAALLVADWLSKNRRGADVARAWLDRHGTAAVPLLVPSALATKAAAWRPAETALRRLAGERGPGPVVAAARDAHGDAAAAAIEALLSAHPAETGLVKPPKRTWTPDAAALPQVRLRDGARAVPRASLPRLLDLLALPVPYRVAELRAACDPASLAAFGRALFELWRDAGEPSRDDWAMLQLGRTGDDATVRLLVPLLRTWPSEGGRARAAKALGVLGGIGTDPALATLAGLAEKAKHASLREAARREIDELARRRGLTSEQLADRLVPSFGLDADGSMTLDYGPRRFVVGFDEELKPYVRDERGKRRASLPKPGAGDDAEAANAARATFAALKKDVRAAASVQIHRLEAAMLDGRRWTARDFREHVAWHPFLRHVARRLLWVAEDGGGATAFRIAEDGTFADVDDEPFEPSESSRVGVVHPLHLGAALPAWSRVFADYEILQPFAQLARPVLALTEDERGGGELHRLDGVTVPVQAVMRLERRGWVRGEAGDGAAQTSISKRVGEDRYVVIGVFPGISVVEPYRHSGDQELSYVRLADSPRDRPRPKDGLRFGDLDPLTASELLHDLTDLADEAL